MICLLQRLVVDLSSVGLDSKFCSPIRMRYFYSYREFFLGLICSFYKHDFFGENCWLNFNLMTVGFNSVDLFTDFFFLELSGITFEIDSSRTLIFECPKSVPLGPI